MTTGSGNILEGGLILLAGMAVAICAWIVRKQQLRSSPPHARRKNETPPTQEPSAGELQSGLVELCERVDNSLNRLEQQSQARISRLEQLVAAADERIKRLEGLKQEMTIAARARAAADQRELVRAARDSANAPRPAAEPRIEPALIEAVAQPAKPDVLPPTKTPAASGQQSVTAAFSDTRRIYEMADKGLTAIKIAEAVDVPLGEVELVLNLRRFAL